MVLVRCLRCRRPVAQYFVEADGAGEWRRRDIHPPAGATRHRCSHIGDELGKLVALGRARRENGFTDIARAPVSVSR